MAVSPTLSICVPSRNRQFWLKHLVGKLAGSLRPDVQFVIVDNSDDPQDMTSFMADHLADPRFVYVPSGASVRSMMDNWEAALNAATGRWVSFIGDDDYCDPEVAGIIRRIEIERPETEAIDWAKLFYSWPDGDRPARSEFISLHTEVHDVPKSLLQARAFGWEDATHVLVCGFSIYHAAISRVLIDRIRTAHDGRFFEFPMVDYESAFKIIHYGRSFVHCRRPLSILGSCPASNSAVLFDRAEQLRRLDIFNKEAGGAMDRMGVFADYPFMSSFGVIAGVGMVHHWFAKRIGTEFRGFERNFARACAAQTSNTADRAMFDAIAECYRQALSVWKDGRFLKDFRPVFTEPVEIVPFRGVHEGSLHMDAGNPWCTSVGDFYDFVSAILVPVKDVAIDLGQFRAVGQPPPVSLSRRA